MVDGVKGLSKTEMNDVNKIIRIKPNADVMGKWHKLCSTRFQW